jgi:hypothetical protein
MTSINERWLNDRTVVQDPEARNLFYKSKALERDVYLTELLTLHADDLMMLLAEVDAQIAELRSAGGSFKELVDSLPPATAKRLSVIDELAAQAAELVKVRMSAEGDDP